MKKINFLIVDDENFARKQISEILKKINVSCNITEAATLVKAKESLSHTKFSIVFLDINLKGETGFDLVPFIPKRTKIVFITAMESYAIRAFEINAIDYILKPPTLDRMKKTMDLMADNSIEKIPTESFTMTDRIFIQANNAIRFVNISDISFIQAKDVYTQIFSLETKHLLVRKSLTQWRKILPENDFIQIHRSTIVNINKIDRIETGNRGTYILFLKGTETPFSVSRTYSNEIKNRLIA